MRATVYIPCSSYLDMEFAPNSLVLLASSAKSALACGCTCSTNPWSSCWKGCVLHKPGQLFVLSSQPRSIGLDLAVVLLRNPCPSSFMHQRASLRKHLHPSTNYCNCRRSHNWPMQSSFAVWEKLHYIAVHQWVSLLMAPFLCLQVLEGRWWTLGGKDGKRRKHWQWVWEQSWWGCLDK